MSDLTLHDLPDGAPESLSFAQERLWFLQQIDPGNPVYHIPLLLRIHVAVDSAALTGALTALAMRHGALRTRIVSNESGEGSQVADRTPVADLLDTDLTSLPVSQRDAAAAALVLTESERAFDLSRGPLWRAGLVRLGESENLVHLTLHHLVADAWSLRVIASDLSELYQARIERRKPALTPLPMSYAEYAVRQRRALRGPALEQALQHWLRSLAGLPVALELPTDRSRPARQSFRGRRQRYALNTDLVSAIWAASRKHRTTIFVLVVAAFDVLLARYTGQTDVAIGMPIANRSDRATAGMVGLLLNTVLLRVDLSGSPGFSEVIGRVRDAATTAHVHAELPFEKLVEAMQPVRDLSRQPLFQVACNEIDLVPRDPLPAGWEDPVLGELRGSKFDLTLHLCRLRGELHIEIEYAADLFDVQTIDRFAAHLKILLRAALADPQRSIWTLPIMADDERRDLLTHGTGPVGDHRLERRVHDLFSERARHRPEAVALVHGDETVSYGELELRSNRVTHYLRRLGVSCDVPVAICADRSIAWAVGLLAILKAGGAYVPLDPAYPKERIASIVRQSGTQHVLAAQRYLVQAQEACGQHARAVSLDECDSGPEHLPFASAVGTSAPNSLAYIFFTSGSTGAPKGAAIEHTGFTNHTFAKIEILGLTAADRVAQTAPASFDICIWQLLAVLVVGGSVLICSEELVTDPAALRSAMAAAGITVFQAVPSLLRTFLDATQDSPVRLPALRALVPTGEALPAELCERWLREVPSSVIVNAYGATECSDDFTHCVIRTPSDVASFVPLGDPIANVRLYVLDGQGAMVPQGVSGELYAGGHVVGRGYVGQPGLTADRFVPDPFSPAGRLYRTGDVVRWRAGGQLEFLGRVDHQIKIRGFRVEPGEVEAVLKAESDVAEVLVLARPDAAGDYRLVAYVVMLKRGSDDAGRLTVAVRAKVPDYMVPSSVMVLERMPLTPNGKIDRKALPAPEFGLDRYCAARTPTEEALMQIWMDVLKLSRVGVHDNFFSLGGQSLLAISVVTRVRRSCGIQASVRDLFEAPTIAALAQRLDARGLPAADAAIVRQPRPTVTLQPLT